KEVQIAGTRRGLLRRPDVSIIGVGKLHALQLGFELEANQLAFRAPVASEREQVLIVQMHGDFVQIGLEGDGRRSSGMVGLAAGFIGYLAEVVLAQVGQEKGTAAMAHSGRVDTPEIYVGALRVADGRIHVWIEGTEPSSAEVVDAGRN